MLDGKQHDVATIYPAFRNRPLHLDHAADAAQMLDQPDALIVRRMNHLNPEPAKIAKDLDGHACSRAQPSVADCLKSSADSLEALYTQ